MPFAPADNVPARALAGLRVLDLSRVLAGPYCCQMLGDHGADVIKVEAPAGDDTRTWGPPYMSNGASAYYTGINRNKRNLCLDLSDSRGQDVLRALLRRTDVLVENFKPGTMERWGLGYEDSLASEFPTLVHCRITGYGESGPHGGRPGYDAVLQAFGGLMSVNGEADGPALRTGVPIVDLVTGLHAFSGILLALQHREKSGLGQLVDCALLDTAVSLLHPHSASWLADGRVPQRTGSAHPTIAPYDSFETATGPVFIAAGNDQQFRALTEVLGRAELPCDERFTANRSRVRHVAALTEEITRAVAPWDREKLVEALDGVGVPAAPVHDVAEALTSAQATHRELVVRRGDYRGVGLPVKLASSPGSIERVPPPLGADTDEVLSELGWPGEEIAALSRDGVAYAGHDPAETHAPRRG